MRRRWQHGASVASKRQGSGGIIGSGARIRALSPARMHMHRWHDDISLHGDESTG